MTTGEVIALIKALSGGGGSGGGVLVVTDTDGTLDKTWQEITDSWMSQKIVALKSGGDIAYLTYFGTSLSGKKRVTFVGNEWNPIYEADSESDYPVVADE